jgi:hypothetical protein
MNMLFFAVYMSFLILMTRPRGGKEDKYDQVHFMITSDIHLFAMFAVSGNFLTYEIRELITACGRKYAGNFE